MCGSPRPPGAPPHAPTPPPRAVPSRVRRAHTPLADPLQRRVRLPQAPSSRMVCACRSRVLRCTRDALLCPECCAHRLPPGGLPGLPPASQDDALDTASHCATQTQFSRSPVLLRPLIPRPRQDISQPIASPPPPPRVRPPTQCQRTLTPPNSRGSSAQGPTPSPLTPDL